MDYLTEYNKFSEDYRLEQMLNKLVDSPDSVNEEIGVAAILGTLLASGKFIEVLGKVGKLAYNKLVDKGIIDGKKIDKTKFEKAGEYVNSMIHKVFKLVAKLIAKVFPMKEDNVDKLADVLFYTTLMIVGTQGVIEVAQAHGGSIAILVEEIAIVMKSLEIGEVIIALILMMSFAELRDKKLKDVAHSMVDCLSNDKKNITALFKKDSRENIVKCTVGKLESH